MASILIVAAEASSCMYAKLFMKSWKKFYPDTHFFGVGDREMKSQGMECVGLAENLAVVGFQEVLSNQREIRKSFHNLVRITETRKPCFALLLDYPGFNLRLTVRLKKSGVPVVYYLSPQLWAWREGRVKYIKQFVDDMMVVFPFEVDFYKKHGIQAHFVGHPLVEIINQEAQNTLFSSHKSPWGREHSIKRKENFPFPEKINEISGSHENRKKTSLLQKPILGLMPGSRKSEIKYNLKIQWLAAQKLMKKYDINVKFLVAPTLEVNFLKQQLPDSSHPVEFLKNKPTEMIRQCDFILAASGTATLQAALCEKPMVVMYCMNKITAFLAKFFVGHLSHYCIVNIIANRRIVPEFIQSEARPECLAKELEKILTFQDYREKMILSLKEISQDLGCGGATENLVRFLKQKYGNS